MEKADKQYYKEELAVQPSATVQKATSSEDGNMSSDTKNTESIRNFYGSQTACVKDQRGLTPCDYYDMLTGIWCAETCAPRLRDRWNADNKTLGQCSVTAFLLQDFFGGKVYGVLRPGGNYHCFNVVENCVFDLTSEQFGDEVLDYTDCTEQFREIHFLKEEKRQRYEFLKQRVIQKLQKE